MQRLPLRTIFPQTHAALADLQSYNRDRRLLSLCFLKSLRWSNHLLDSIDIADTKPLARLCHTVRKFELLCD